MSININLETAKQSDIESFLKMHAKTIEDNVTPNIADLSDSLRMSIRVQEAKRYLEIWEIAKLEGNNPTEALFTAIVESLRDYSFRAFDGDNFYQAILQQKQIFNSEILRWVTYKR